MLGDERATPAQYRDIERELEGIQRDIGLDAVWTWREELRLRLGMPKGGMERVLHLAESVRRGSRRPMPAVVVRYVRWWWWWDALVAGTVGLVGVVAASGLRDGSRVQAASEGLRLTTQVAEMHRELDRVNALGTITTTEFQHLRTDVASAAEPDAEVVRALPEAVAVLPAKVVVTSSAGPRAEYTRPLGAVIAVLPEPQQAAVIQSYTAGWERRASGTHSFRSFSVTSGDGSMTITVIPP